MNMKSVRLFIQLVTLVSLLLLVVSCMPTTTNELDDQFFQDAGNASNNSQIATASNVPFPTATVPFAYPASNSSEATQSAYPAPAPSVVAQSAYVAPPEPTPTWWPTPRPSPVRVEQPTPTAIPIRQPSNTTSGALYYVVIDDDEPTSLLVAPVTDGAVIDRNEEQDLLELQNSRFIRLYPSPTNDMLAIIESGMGDVVTILNLEQKQVMPIHDSISVRMPSSWVFEGWHSNGRHFLINDANGFLGLWLIDGAGLEKPVMLTEHDPDSASMSPTSQMLAYAYRPELAKKSLLILAWEDGSHAQVLLELPSSTSITELSWSPDGTTLAYVKGGYEIWVYTNGKHIQLLGGYKARSGYSWSPDSRFIAYTGRTGINEPIPTEVDPTSINAFKYVFNNTELRIIDVENSVIYVPSPQDSIGSLLPTWSPDGSFVIFTTIQNEQLVIAKVDIEKLESTQVEKMFDTEYMINSAVWVAPVEE